MALTLGLHRPHDPRPVLYWSCIIAARWQSLKEPSSRALSPLCFDLDNASPMFEPKSATIFGSIYHLLARADTNRHLSGRASTLESNILPTIRSGFQMEDGSYLTPNLTHKLQVLVEMLAQYLSDEVEATQACLTDEEPNLAFQLNPFHEIRHRILSGQGSLKGAKFYVAAQLESTNIRPT
jgi:hypothetical protein